MSNQLKRMALIIGLCAATGIIGSDAFALGRSKKSGYNGWNQSNNNSENSNNDKFIDKDENGRPSRRDSNPVPEPASLVLLGSALAGLGGYRAYRKRQNRR